MNKLKEYKKIEKQIEKLAEKKDKLKKEIIQKIKSLKCKSYIGKTTIFDGKYSAYFVTPKTIIWDVEKAEKLFLKLNMKECLTIKVDNLIVRQYEDQKKLDTRALNKLRTFINGDERLYVNINEK